MDGDEKRHIADAAFFRGQVMGKLESIEKRLDGLTERLESGPADCLARRRECYRDHIEPMQKAVQDLRDEVTRLVTKVSIWAGILGTVSGVAASVVVAVITRHLP
jgi:hypothetical protein